MKYYLYKKMNKIMYCLSGFFFASASFSAVSTPQTFEEFFEQWKKLTDSAENRIKARVSEGSGVGPDDEILDTISSPEGQELYTSIAKFNHRYDPEAIKQNTLNVCKTFSQDPSETEMSSCKTKFVQNREALCKAAPIIARDTCADILNTTFPSDASPAEATSAAAQNSSSEKSSRLSNTLNKVKDKMKFWNRSK